MCVLLVRVGGSCCFFFQAEDGIRETSVTGVQTCALPIYGNQSYILKLYCDTDVPANADDVSIPD